MNRMSFSLFAPLAAAFIAAGAHAQTAVQWRVEDGGNGHWYCVVLKNRPTWHDCLLEARARGGDLASIASQSEHEFVVALALPITQAYVGVYGPYIGGYQDTSAPTFVEPLGAWRWTDGTPWIFTAWHPSGEPNNCLGSCSGSCRSENVIQVYGPSEGSFWNDIAAEPDTCGGGWIASAYILEWSADCDSDGIVDYGQILDGTLEDLDANGVPDCCELGTPCECIADIVADGSVDSTDLSIVLNAWGTPGGSKFDADLNDDGDVNGTDLAIVLFNWGPCS